MKKIKPPERYIYSKGAASLKFNECIELNNEHEALCLYMALRRQGFSAIRRKQLDGKYLVWKIKK